MAAFDVKYRCPPRGRALMRLFAAASAAGAALVLCAPGAHAQRLPPADCLQPGEPLYRIPVLGSQPNGKLTGTFVLTDELRRLGSSTDCALQYLRHFVSKDAVPPPILPGSDNPIPSPVGAKYPDGFPGPTLRARIGDIVQLTFLNQVNPLNYPNSLDRGDAANSCDQFSSGYPASVSDSFPNCLHGSSTANIHFHGTHVNPTSTGDNVFLQIRPSPRANNQPIVTGDSVSQSFTKFFADCEAQLKPNVLSEWPYTWKDLPQPWTQEQEKLLKAYDAGTTPYFPPPKPLAQQLWPANQEQIDGNLWPQYYVGAFPYCFQIPEYKAANWPPPAGSPLKMGQSPGTHWYHAHKHGSTALNVANGMTGVFVIEGKYDDELNAFYGDQQTPLWTRTQPVLVINQLGVTPNLARGSGGPEPFSVNGRAQPKLTMRPGEVQLWRIVNTSGQRAAFFVGPPKLDPTKKGYDPKTDFEWRQLAQDGVQFFDTNYQSSQNISLMVAAGNRVDLLVKAPTNPGNAPYNFQVKPNNSSSKLKTTTAVTLLSVAVSGNPPENVKRTQFIPRAPAFPRFLADITDDEVRYTPKRTFVFDSKGQGSAHQHTLNGEQFSETGIGVTTFLSSVEEWKVMNTTIAAGAIDHPFHIHVNPFQVVEVFDPNEQITDPNDPTKQLDKYVTDPPTYPKLQCQLNLNDPDTWKDCHNPKQRWAIWWDVFPIPTARGMTPTGGGTAVTVPGFFRMRSRFVDFPGLWVIHCHILAHEDRGMMTIVQVLPVITPQMKHH